MSSSMEVPQANPASDPSTQSPFEWRDPIRELKLFRILLDQSNESIEVVDPASLRFLDLNQKACDELGYTRDELLSLTVFDIDPDITRQSTAEVMANLRQCGSLVFETIHRRKDGTTFPVEVSVKRVELDREYIVILSRNITERKRRTDRLQEFERVVEALEEMIVVVNHDYRYILANRAFLHYRGMTKDQVIGRDVAEVLQSDAYELIVRQKLDECFRGKVVEFEMKYRYPGLGDRDIAVTYLPVEGPTGINRAAGVLRDITDRKRAAFLLEESEKRFRTVYEKSPVGMCLVDSRSGRFLQVNPKYCELTGRTEQDLLSRDFFSITHPEDLPDNITNAIQLANGRTSSYEMEKRYIRPDGSVRWVNICAANLPVDTSQTPLSMAVVQDVTDRKEAEEACIKSEARERTHARELETVLDVLPIPVLIAHDPQCRDISANRAGRELFRAQAGENLSLTAPTEQLPQFRLLRDGVEVPGDQLPMQLAASTGQSLRQVPTTIVFPDGTQRMELANAEPLLDDKGKIRGAVGASIDVTESKLITAALLKSETHFRMLFEQASDGIFLSTSDGKYVDVNSAGAAMLGYTRDEILRLSIPEILAPGEVERVAPEVARFADGSICRSEWMFKRKDGSCFPGEVVGRALPDGRLQGILRDTTERRLAEEALRSSEERLRLAQDSAGIGTFERSCATGEVRVTEQMAALFGLTSASYPKNLEGFFDLAHPEDRKTVEGLVARSLDTGEASGEWRVIWPDGTVRWILGSWRVVKDAAGRPIRFIGADIDITDRKRVEEELRRAKEKLAEEKLYLERQIDTEFGFEEIIGQSQALKAVMENVAKVASSDATVLLLGETGTGKELVARAIHRLSRRSGNAFIKMNCAAIPSGLLESELFGNEKGAFTGAVSKKIGRLELADKGTIFLDEIGDIDLALQPKLLRVLQDQEFERLGGTQTIKVNFRLIAATNRDLAESVRENAFRSDLYYRLNVFPIALPPLRERREDIPLLVEHFVKKIARRMGKSITSIPKKTMNALVGWSWPGNVRELENFVERSVILTFGSVLAAPLGELESPVAERIKDETLEAAEREHILHALRLSRGQISGPRGAATRLGMKRTTLQSKLKRLGINPRVRAAEK